MGGHLSDSGWARRGRSEIKLHNWLTLYWVGGFL